MIDKPISNTRYDLWETIEEYAARVKRHNDRITLWNMCCQTEVENAGMVYLYTANVPDAIFYADKDPEIA